MLTRHYRIDCVPAPLDDFYILCIKKDAQTPYVAES